MAGPEGLEPSTLGFGVRCSTNWSYGPATGMYSTLLRFFMQGMFFTEFTEFVQFQLTAHVLLVD